MEGFEGAIAREASAGGPTVRVVEAFRPPNEAEIVAVPCVTP